MNGRHDHLNFIFSKTSLGDGGVSVDHSPSVIYQPRKSPGMPPPEAPKSDAQTLMERYLVTHPQ